MKSKAAAILLLGLSVLGAQLVFGQAGDGWSPDNGSWWSMLGSQKKPVVVQGAYLEGFHAGFSLGVAEQRLADSNKPDESNNGKTWIGAVNKATLSPEMVAMSNFYQIPQNQPICVEDAVPYVDAQLEGKDVSSNIASSRKDDAKKGCLYRYKP